MKTWIVDTGPLVAYLDAGDPAHDLVVEALDAFGGRLITTSAVVTEAMHLVAGTRGGARLLVEMVLAARIRIHEISRPAELFDAVELMEKFGDTPMDFADATLLVLAAQARIFDIATLDVRGFSVYRTTDGRPMSLVLGR